MKGTPVAKQTCCSVLKAHRAFTKENMLGQAEQGLAYTAGADDAEVPPVVVKLCRAEDSWLETTRKNR